MPDEYGAETLARQAATIHRVVGPTILLGSGNYFDFEAPGSSAVGIGDVACGLAYEGRFSGQCVRRRNGSRPIYVVAQHCVEFSRIVPPGHEYDALMHELGEFACGDVSSPLKSLCPDYKAVEKRCEAALQEAFRVPMRDRQLIKEYDIVMLAWERRDLMRWSGEKWATETAFPLPERELVPWHPYRAAREFMLRFREVAPDEVLASFGLARPGRGILARGVEKLRARLPFPPRGPSWTLSPST